MQDDQSIIVIGSGLAAYSFVREFRKINTETPVLMISQDDAHSYSKPMLSTGFAKKKSAEELSMADPGKMAAQLKMSIRNFTTVTKIDTENSRIFIGNEAISFSKLVLALNRELHSFHIQISNGHNQPSRQTILVNLMFKRL